MSSLIFRLRWSPYAVGALIGILSWITFALMDKALGVSTSFVGASGLLLNLFAPDYVKGNEYLAKHVVQAPVIDWQFALVFMLALGAMAAARLSGAAAPSEPTETWRRRFGPSVLKRRAAAFAGGVLVLFGARMAGGCTSGHGISGGLQLAVSSWLFFAVLFVVGISAAHLLYGKRK